MITRAESQPPPPKKLNRLKPTEKDVHSSAHGFLVQLISYAAERLLTLNEFCVIGDQRHLFENSSLLKPAVCYRDLCVFVFQTFDVMADVTGDFSTSAEVADLLIA